MSVTVGPSVSESARPSNLLLAAHRDRQGPSIALGSPPLTGVQELDAPRLAGRRPFCDTIRLIEAPSHDNRACLRAFSTHAGRARPARPRPSGTMVMVISRGSPRPGELPSRRRLPTLRHPGHDVVTRRRHGRPSTGFRHQLAHDARPTNGARHALKLLDSRGSCWCSRVSVRWQSCWHDRR